MGTTQVLPGILQKHCCILPDRNTESQCTLCGEPEGLDSLTGHAFAEEDGGDLLKTGISFPGTPEEELDQPYSWSPTQQSFNEERYSPVSRNMKGLSGNRNQSQLCSAHTCGLASPEDCEHSHDHLHHGQESRQSYLLSPTESCPMDHHRCSPRSSIHSECMMMPMVMGDHMSSSTFPRMHYTSHYDTRDDCTMSHANTKINRIPANLLDQFEKQLPLHRDGFHTLQYQRTSTAAEQRSESPGRIRHLVHSVQKLFTKSHSLEGSSKSNVNGAKGDGRGDDHHHGHHSKHSKRSKSKERKPESKHKTGMSSWWSSDDNLDSDSTYRTPSVVNRHHVDHISHCYPEAVQGHFGDLSLKTSKSNNDVKCSACEGLAMTPDGKYMKRSSWSTLTVSQAKEAYRKSSLNLDKPLVHQEIKPPLRPCHYLQVPQDEWGGYPAGGKDEEIPCRRMRSGSYIKAMGDEESGDSDTSPKTSPKVAVHPESLLKSIGQRALGDHQNQSYLQATSEVPGGHTLDPSANYNSPKFRSRNQSYMRAVSTLSQASCVSQVEAATDSDTDSRGLREYHSVGVQVEDDKRHGRFKRSNSVTAAVQADLELEGFPGHITMEDKGLQFGGSFQRHSEPSTPTQYGAVRTVRTQGLFSYREDYRTQVDTSNLPPPEPWLEPSIETVETGRMSPCRRDGSWFMKLLHTETKRMEGWCKEMEREAEENDLSEEILGKIRSAVGSAQLLMSQKFQQFYWLCQQNLDPSAMPRPTSQDLAGFWDLLQLSIEDVSMKFDELHQLKLNEWKIIESPEKKEERKVPPPVPKKPPKGKFPITREKSLDLPDRQRQEARRRLMAAKRAASFRQNSATERADSIEIYIPEAQTRL
ncbi:disks large-associated protein 2 isoform 4-T6 [Liasis olivaceus]